MKKNLVSRLFSAVIALVILFITIYFFEEKGVYALVLFVVFRGSYEMARMLFDDHYPKFAKFFYIFISVFSFLLISNDLFKHLTGLLMIFFFVSIVCCGILFHKKFKDIDSVLTFITKSISSLVYTCFLPTTVVWTTNTNNGMEWFFCLLAVVFAGDIGAFIFGSLWGKTKIAPSLSPNKSVQGAIGGLLFSCLAALAFSFVLTNTPAYSLVLCGLIGGFLGQVGDFFESLIKRISGVKDSGSIMPGHGGVLDRLDGVLLAAPFFYLMALYFSL